MIDEQLLRQGLQKLLNDTESAIRDRLSDAPTLEANLRERHAAAVRAERTEGSARGYNAFADEAITQAAVHWLLGCVFVRFLEDNGWLDERNAKVAWIAGPADRLAIAKDRRTLFLRPDPNLTDRDYLLHVFAEVAKLPGVAGLFDQKHNPLYSLQPTAHGAAKIVEFFQKLDTDSNALIHDFSDPAHGTRFLGDLYQNLSESARKRYALCQTPGFVIDFILDRTLTPALDAFGLSEVRMIDPSCGSGHFLLAGFDRLFTAWQAKEPGTNPPALAQRALDAVYGVDLNPFAVEISRFRLLIAALETSGIERLRDAPQFQINLAAGDSLLHGSRSGGGGIARELFEDRLQHFYDTEDAEELKRILGQTYRVVVGNPPYINVADPVLRDAYRARFSTCHGSYQLGVPFTERFLDLTFHDDGSRDLSAGWMGMIVSNAFMKREFGRKLIEEYLHHKDLTHVIDTSGAYLPGHATPTAILIARNREPLVGSVRVVRGIRGEIGKPEDASLGAVWREISGHADEPGFQGQCVSVADAPRSTLEKHPWALGGGGLAELRESLESTARQRLGEILEDIGCQAVTRADDAFVLKRTSRPQHIPASDLIPFVLGEDVRDWSLKTPLLAIWPYKLPDLKAGLSSSSLRLLYPCRSILNKRVAYGNTQAERGLEWYEYSMLFRDRLRSAISIVYADVATHNHFALASGKKVFNRHASVIILRKDVNPDLHFGLLGVLNSSVACFWMRQVCQSKGAGGIGGGLATELWEYRYEFDSTKVQELPLPGDYPQGLAECICSEAEARAALLPDRICESGVPTHASLDEARAKASLHLMRMIALQEELDWRCYYLYGLIDHDLTVPLDQLPGLALGERTFEINLARQIEQSSLHTAWFKRHGSRPATQAPGHWPEAYREVHFCREKALQNNSAIALLEQPEYKRRWNLPSWDEMQAAALNNWLLDRIEENAIWKHNRLVSCSQLRDTLAQDPEWLSVAEIYNDGPVEALDQFVQGLVIPESVPHLPILRYSESGLRKHAEWESVWDLQRKEDAGDKVEIPVPPKYVSKDMLKDCWRLRGGLDVPKERFILYPSIERDSDSSPVLGWAGWNHLDQARALATYYQRMRTEEGWEPERLKPILAGLLELKSWLLQWHNDLDPEMGERLGEYFVRYAESQCQELGFSPEVVRAWQPAPATATGRGRRRTS